MFTTAMCRPTPYIQTMVCFEYVWLCTWNRESNNDHNCWWVLGSLSLSRRNQVSQWPRQWPHCYVEFSGLAKNRCHCRHGNDKKMTIWTWSFLWSYYCHPKCPSRMTVMTVTMTNIQIVTSALGTSQGHQHMYPVPLHFYHHCHGPSALHFAWRARGDGGRGRFPVLSIPDWLLYMCCFSMCSLACFHLGLYFSIALHSRNFIVADTMCKNQLLAMSVHPKSGHHSSWISRPQSCWPPSHCSSLTIVLQIGNRTSNKQPTKPN